MTEHEARIEELVNTPPQVTWSTRQRLIVLGIWILAMVGVVGMTVAVVRVSAVASCINTNLGQRSAPSAADAKAHIDYARAQSVAQMAQSKTGTDLFVLLTAPKDKQAAAYTLFLSDFAKSRAASAALAAADATYVNTLQHDQDLRDSHPLGRC